jgi:hypothetical protein
MNQKSYLTFRIYVLTLVTQSRHRTVIKFENEYIFFLKSTAVCHLYFRFVNTKQMYQSASLRYNVRETKILNVFIK